VGIDLARRDDSGSRAIYPGYETGLILWGKKHSMPENKPFEKRLSGNSDIFNDNA
jgi:hypothetical protein